MKNKHGITVHNDFKLTAWELTALRELVQRHIGESDQTFQIHKDSLRNISEKLHNVYVMFIMGL